MGDWTDDLPDDWPDEGPDEGPGEGLEDLAGGDAGSDDHSVLDPDGLARLGDHADGPSVDEQTDPWDLEELEELEDGGRADLLGLFDGLGDPDASGDEHPDPFELAVVADGDGGELGGDQAGSNALLDQDGLAQQAGGVEPPTLADAWVDALGRGAVDPAGTHDSVFGLLGWDGDDRSDRYDDALDDMLGSGASSWLDSSEADPDGWLHSALLAGDDEGALGTDGDPTGGADPGAATAAIDDLWDRLAPGEALPTDSAGGPDHAGALDLLAERAGSAALLDVVAAARRLVEPRTPM